MRVSGNQILPRRLLDELAAGGFLFEEVADPDSAIAILRDQQFDLVVLKLGAPEKRGLEYCRKIRDPGGVTGIITLRHDGTAADDIPALEAGADDCILAPFRFRSLAGRMRAALRARRALDMPQAQVLRAGELELNSEWRELRRGLMKRPGIPLTHTRLLQGVWKNDPAGTVDTLRVYIRVLREKVEQDPRQPGYILTEPWVGYRFRDPNVPGL